MKKLTALVAALCVVSPVFADMDPLYGPGNRMDIVNLHYSAAFEKGAHATDGMIGNPDVLDIGIGGLGNVGLPGTNEEDNLCPIVATNITDDGTMSKVIFCNPEEACSIAAAMNALQCEAHGLDPLEATSTTIGETMPNKKPKRINMFLSRLRFAVFGRRGMAQRKEPKYKRNNSLHFDECL